MDIDQAHLHFQSSSLWLLNAILGLVMFGIAIDLKWSDFRHILDAPRAPLIGLAGQFVLLPAITFVLCWVLHPAPSVALGMILVAACPGGNLSNFLTYLGKGNAALSVSMTMMSTVVALFMTPFNLSFWGSMYPDTAALLHEIRLDPVEVLITVCMILGLPLVAGVIFANRLPKVAERLHKPFKFGAVGFFLLFLVVVFTQNFDVFRNYIGWVAIAVILQNAIALSTSYAAARAARLPVADARAISLEVGIQNSALALSLIFTFFDGLGGMAVVAGFWGVWHVISGMSLAFLWSRNPPLETVPEGV